MSVLREVMEAVVQMAQSADGVYATIVNASLPPDNGISMTLAGGGSEPFFSLSQRINLSVVINAKNTEQQAAIDALANIHAALTRTKSLPSTSDWQITAITTTNEPSFLSREENAQWLYGSAVDVKFCYFNA